MDKTEKAELQSMNVAADKRWQLAQLFPEVVTETRTEDGQLVHAVDFEKLKGALGEFSEVPENQRERYGMTWPGKNECLKIIQQPSVATLKPCRGESVNFDETENLFIEGDNLEVLKLLQKAYYGKVKMIYIDPPYNTGSDFIYPDDYSETLETYLAYTGQIDDEGRKFSTNTESEGRYHSKWLRMMYPRLYLAKNLLRDDGLIFISIDDIELKNLRVLCDEIFGEENFIDNIIWKKRYGGGAKERYLVSLQEYVLCYARNKEAIPALDVPLSKESIVRYYKSQDEKYATRGGYRTHPLEATKSMGERENLVFPIPAPDGTEVWPKRQWLWSKDRTLRALENKDLEFVKTDDGWTVHTKQYLKDEAGNIRKGKAFSIIDDVFTQHGTNEIIKLFGDAQIFPFPKPTGLLLRLIDIATEPTTSDLLLDFFAGSATLGHATFLMNKRDGGNRRVISVQLPEPCEEGSAAFKAGHKSIADIGKDRLRKAAALIVNDAEDSSADLSEGEDKAVHTGFRTFKLTRSNFRLWNGSQPSDDPEKIARQLELHEQHIDPNATPEDILYELLLKAGFPLTTKVEKVEMAGKEVFSISDGALLICLQDEITTELIKAMADADPLQVICLDSGFKNNDQLKANAVQTFKVRNRGKDKESSIVFRTV